MFKHSSAIYLGAVILSLLLLPSCTTQNEPYYPLLEDAIVFDKREAFDMAYVEFSEHGNLFNRDILSEIENKIQRTESEKPIALVVFAHGWFNNAISKNAEDFEVLLEKMAARKKYQNHRVVGIYIGWRGASITLPGIEFLTYWDRKTVADEVGHGGVTEVLLRLERLTRCGTISEKCDQEGGRGNQLVIIGHSFGGAVVFSALSEIFAERLINAERLDADECERFIGDKSGRYSRKRGAECVLANKFAHAVVLLNPAIEANRAFQLKEIIASHQYSLKQRTLMHILSSDADLANKIAFPIGQWLKNLTWKEAQITRTYRFPRENTTTIDLHESELTTSTIGNFPPFRTGLIGTDNSYIRCWDNKQRDNCMLGSDLESHMPSSGNEPIQFIQTDKWLMDGHNDVFNCRVRSYILAIAEEALQTDKGEHFQFKNTYNDLLNNCPPEK